MTPRQIELFKYAPTTSCDVKKNFSQYKSNSSFVFKNLKEHIITACNNN